MADDKKNIGPEIEKPGEAPQEKKAEPIKDTPPVAGAAGSRCGGDPRGGSCTESAARSHGRKPARRKGCPRSEGVGFQRRKE